MSQMDESRVKEIVAMEMSRRRYQGDPSFFFLSSSIIGDPVKLFDDYELFHSWIVPISAGSRVCGVAQVVDEKVVRLIPYCKPGGAGGLDYDFFYEPPRFIVNEITKKYGAISDPLLSFDESIVKWGWRVFLRVEGEERKAYIFHNGWVLKTKSSPGYEG